MSDPPARPRPPRSRRRRGRSGDAAAKPAGTAAGSASPGGGGRRRRRRRPPRDGKPTAPIVPEVSQLAAPATAAETDLDAAGIAEMKEHLAYIRTYKDVLRLKLNATEDLLVNGRREPKERGICRHLLGKIDRTVIERAVAREPLASDAPARARMLAGAIRLTADIGVLLDYLETLAQLPARSDAARAFAEIVGRLDFGTLSSARLSRVLQVLVETFAGHDRVQVLFGLLAEPAFRATFDRAEADLPPGVGEVFAPLRAVHRRLHDEADQATPDLLARGLEQVLSAPDATLQGYAEPLRVRLVEMTLRPGMPHQLTDRAAGVLLSSLDGKSRIYARLALRRAGQLLARQLDDVARTTLDELTRTQPDFRIARRWRSALDAPAVGRFTLVGDEAPESRLVRAFWLDAQRACWIRTAAASDGERLTDEAELQQNVALPGVAGVVDHGVANDRAYVAVAATGRPIDPGKPERALGITTAVARILHALGLAGVVLPDASPGRFLQSGDEPTHLVLADLDGAQRGSVATALGAHAQLALDTARTLLAPDELDTPLTDQTDLPHLVAILDRALLQHRTD